MRTMRWATMLAGTAGIVFGCSTQYKNTAFQSFGLEVYGPPSADAKSDPFKLTSKYTVTVKYFEDAAGKVPYGTSLKTLPKGYENFTPTVVSSHSGSPAGGTLTPDGKDAALPRLSADQTDFYVSAEVDGLDATGKLVARARCSLMDVKADPTGQLGPVTCRAYYGAVGLWNTTRSMKVPRVDFAAVPLPDGRIVVAGGRTPDSDPTNIGATEVIDSIEVYDPFARDGEHPTDPPGTWTLVSGTGMTLFPGRFGLTGTLMPSGKVIFAGGLAAATLDKNPPFPTNRFDVFDPTSQSGGPSLAHSTLPEHRALHAAALSGGANVLLVGGESMSGSFPDITLQPAKNLDVITPDNISSGTMPQQVTADVGTRLSSCLTALDDSNLLLCSGNLSGSSVDSPPNSSSCAVIGSNLMPHSAGTSVTPREQTRCAAVNGVAFIVGGEPDGTVGSNMTIDLWQADTSANGMQIMTFAPEPYSMVDHGVAAANGQVLVAGGRNASSSKPNPNAPLANAVLIDPAVKKTQTVAAMHVARAGHQLIGLPDGTVMAVGGSADGSAEIFTMPEPSH